MLIDALFDYYQYVNVSFSPSADYLTEKLSKS